MFSEICNGHKACPFCGLHVKRDYPAAQMAGQLKSFADRLRRFAIELAAVDRETP